MDLTIGDVVMFSVNDVNKPLERVRGRSERNVDSVPRGRNHRIAKRNAEMARIRARNGVGNNRFRRANARVTHDENRRDTHDLKILFLRVTERRGTGSHQDEAEQCPRYEGALRGNERQLSGTVAASTAASEASAERRRN